MAWFNKFVRFLTKQHDARLARQSPFQQDSAGNVKLSDYEKEPSVMLAFDIIEKKSNEAVIITLLGKILEKNNSVKTQYSSAGETLLITACKKGYCKVIPFLIDKGLSCKQVTPLGTVMHSLFDAFENDNLSYEKFREMTILVQGKDCDINEVNHRNMTPFLCAVESGNIRAMTLFIELNCDVNKHGVKGYHALHIACIKYRPDILEFLFSIDNLHKHTASEDGSTPLYTAVNEWNDTHSKVSSLGEKHLPVRFKQQMQVLALVERLLLAGQNPYSLSTKKDVKLPVLLFEMRKTETGLGKSCRYCHKKENLSRMSTMTVEKKGTINSLEHDCNHEYIGCPCKLTLLYTGKNISVEGNVEDTSENNTQSHGYQVRVDVYGNDAVPLTSQMLASTLLYGSNHPKFYPGMLMKSFINHNFSNYDLVDDPYLQYLRRYFSSEHMFDNSPLSLKILCRSVLRVCLATNATLYSLHNLPLPKQLLEFVAMKVIA